ncbi:MAG: GNAT family N-acetyltransferase [Actinomycetales bacterium]|nr:GNAT family N-acetyltransferase [Actinomycetales bacterium]
MSIAPDGTALQNGIVTLRPLVAEDAERRPRGPRRRGASRDAGGDLQPAVQADIRNTRSQAAIARLGAVREGVVRRDIRRPGGTFRDTVVFSILSDEWPEVSDRLLARLGRCGWAPSPASPLTGVAADPWGRCVGSCSAGNV